jgi:sirohydrochlorin cobaltochelatase
MCKTKKALLVISFGTSHTDARKAIENIENGLKEKYDGYDFYRAFTSKFIVAKMLKRDKTQIDSPKQALQRLYDQGYTEVAIQSLHVIAGIEYEKIARQVEAFSDNFESISLGKPLLSSASDYQQACGIVDAYIGKRADDCALLLMGHGTSHDSSACYSQLENMFAYLKINNVFVSVVEGFPDISVAIEKLKKAAIKKVILMPFMIVFGDHAKNDMASDEPDSWKTILKNSGFDVVINETSLGQIDAITQMFYRHSVEANKG